jgi:hypothetical protein
MTLSWAEKKPTEHGISEVYLLGRRSAVYNLAILIVYEMSTVKFHCREKPAKKRSSGAEIVLLERDTDTEYMQSSSTF